MELEIRVDPAITSYSKRATFDDITSLHSVSDDGLTGEGTTVVVADSGIDNSHPVFRGDKSEVIDLTDSSGQDKVGHGTAVAGIIKHMAPDAEIIALQIFGDEGRVGPSVFLKMYQWLIENNERYDIVNMSFGTNRKVRQIDILQNRLVATGIHDVVAAGNTSDRGGSPATAENAFSVGACTENGEMTRFSSYNPNWENPDVTALGKDIILPRAEGTTMGHVVENLPQPYADIGGEWVKASGTSFAAPIQAALTARYLELERGIDPDDSFTHTARDITETSGDGYGISDYNRACYGEPVKPVPDKTDIRVYGIAGVNVIITDEDVLETGRYGASVSDKEGGYSVQLDRNG